MNETLTKQSVQEESETLYFHSIWQKSPAGHRPERTVATGNILLFAGGEDVWQQLKPQCEKIILVKPGRDFGNPAEQVYEINPENNRDYIRLIEELKIKNLLPSYCVHMWNAGIDPAAEPATPATLLTNGVYSIFHLAGAISEVKIKVPDRFIFIYGTASQAPNPYLEAAAGYCRSLVHIFPHLAFTTVEIEPGPASTKAAQIVLQELTLPIDPQVTEISYRGHEPGQRHIKKLIPFEPGQPSPLPLKQRGVYLITGGAGGLGLILAQYLVQHYRAQLILTGRSELNQLNPDKKAQLEKLGAGVLYLRADAANLEDMTRVMSTIKEKFPALDGVIHTAGVLGDKTILQKDISQFQATLQPKVWGTVLLDQVTQDQPLDFFVLFSSISAVLGDFGQCDYAVGNRFMNAFAHQREILREQKQRRGTTIAMGWPLWQEGGMTSRKDDERFYMQSSGMAYLENKDGLSAFSKLLTAGYPNVMIMSGVKNKVYRILNIPAVAKAPDLDVKLETDLKKIVSQSIKIDAAKIDAGENLGSYGLDSISLKDIATVISTRYGIEILPTVFFQQGNLRNLSRYIVKEFHGAINNYYGATATQPTQPAQAQPFPPAETKKAEQKTIKIEEAGTADTTGTAGTLELKPRPRMSHLSRQNTRRQAEMAEMAGMEIAVIGAHGRFPGAKNLEEFWQNLLAGKDAVTEIPPDRWDWREHYSGGTLEKNKSISKWGGFISGIEMFDASFFNFSPREAVAMDPQQRLLLETMWKTVEDAGYRVSDFSGKPVGVFIGVEGGDYIQVLKEKGESSAQVITGNHPAVLANRISFLLDLRGVSETINTACSSSLVALAQAVRAIQNGDCRMALAGGVSLIIYPGAMAAESQMGILSPDGKCKTFDKRANGYVRGEGVGAVLLKPLDKAIADHDHIYAVIKSAALNHGGKAHSFTAPNSQAQAQLLIKAYQTAQVDPGTVTYLETHGTGTELGDPVEVEGIKSAFTELAKKCGQTLPTTPYCGLGTVKTNIGHLEAASGIAGFIKTILALKNKTLPKILHFRELNPYINLKDTPFYIVDKTTPWKQPQDSEGNPIPRRAGVSSFGFGGTNAHIVLEEAPSLASFSLPLSAPAQETNGEQLILLSARTEETLRNYAADLASFLAKKCGLPADNRQPQDLPHLSHVQDEIIRLMAPIINVEYSHLHPDETFAELGFDAVTLAELNAQINRQYHLELGPGLFLDINSPRELARYLAAEISPKSENIDSSIDSSSSDSEYTMANIAFTLQVGRETMDERLAVMAANIEELITKLNHFTKGPENHESANTGSENIYRGSTNNKIDIEALLQGEESAEMIRVLINKRKLQQLAKLWISGMTIDWNRLYTEARPNRVSLPSYPFAPRRYWLGDPPKLAKSSQDNLNNYLYIPRWKPLPAGFMTSVTQSVLSKQKILIAYFTPARQLKEALAEAHRQPGLDNEIIELDLEKTPWQIEDNHIQVIYFLGGIQPGTISLDDFAALEQAQEWGVLSLFRLVKRLSDRGLSWKPLQLRIITNDVQPVLPGAAVKPQAGGLYGLARSIAREFLKWKVDCIDISLESTELTAGSPVDWQETARQILVGFQNIENLGINESTRELALRSNKAYVHTIESLGLPEVNQTSFKQNGVYLTIGGAGGIGMELNTYLAQTVRARLVLVGRSPLDEDKKEKIQRLGSFGAKALYISADAADYQAMKKTIETTISHFGRLDGIIFSAVVLAGGLLEKLDEEQFKTVLTPKIKGTASVMAALADRPLDFIMFFSSIQALSGGVGAANYNAACTFTDAFGHALQRRPGASYAVKILNWGYWAGIGVGADIHYHKHLSSGGVQGIPPAEGMQTIEKILACPVVQVIPFKAETPILERIGIDIHHRIRSYPTDLPSLLEKTIGQVNPPSIDAGKLNTLQQAREDLENKCRYFLLETFQRMGVFKQPGEKYPKEDLAKRLQIIPAYYRLFDSLLDILARLGAIRFDNTKQEIVVTAEPAGPTGPALKKEQSGDWHPSIKAHAVLLQICLDNFPAILRGEIPATDIIFPGSSTRQVEGIYRSNEAADYYNHLVAQVLLTFIRARLPLLKQDEKIKILEIGAGTGGTSSVLFPGLRPYGEKLEYIYTDISLGFIYHGRKEYGGQNPFVQFNTLDIEKEPTSQGFIPGDFDVVIATNVLHATRNIRRTLGNVKTLLKTNGWLTVNEVTAVKDHVTLIFGLLEGWWLYEDGEERLAGSPLLGARQWESVLKEEGFEKVHLLGMHGVPPGTGSQHVIIAESNGQVREENVPVPASLKIPEIRPLEEPAPVTAADTRNIPDSPQRPHPGTRGTRRSTPAVEVEQKILQVLSAVLQMNENEFAGDTTYSEFGVDSILAIEIINRLNNELGITLRSTDLFSYATIKKLAAYIEKEFSAVLQAKDNDTAFDGPGQRCQASPSPVSHFPVSSAPSDASAPSGEPARLDKTASGMDIAVIGISARFPDAANIDEYWQNLAAGHDSVREITRWPLDTFYDPGPNAAGKGYCKWGAFLSGIDTFDPLFFGISPREAELMDPQQRLFLQESWRALEDAGYSDHELDEKKCGVFVGVNFADYHKLIDAAHIPPEAYAFLGNSEAILGGRVSYFLNLRGPAITVNTACSASLAAVHLACESIRSGVSEMALAGGVQVLNSPEFHIGVSKTEALSPDGKCRAFDQKANGFVPGEGVGVVVLKSLEKALADRDHIYGIIAGSGINQDGKTNGLTAPSAPSQTALETDVYRRYHIHPRNITYVETHGTGTRLGDPIEMSALTDAFRGFTNEKQYCAVGSVKTNIGHTLAAAGIASFIKVLLSLEHKQIPPSLNFEKENELIDFKNSPFYVNTRLQDWVPPQTTQTTQISQITQTTPGSPRLAAVSSFGFSGTNAHLVVQEMIPAHAAHAAHAAHVANATKSHYLFAVSAKTQKALHRRLQDLAGWLEKNEDGPKPPSPADISYTLLVRRSHFSHRAACIAADSREAARHIRDFLTGNTAAILTHDTGLDFKPDTETLQNGEKILDTLPQFTLTPGYPEKLSLLAGLYVKGYPLDWRALYHGEDCHCISLPTYPFAEDSYWINGTNAAPGLSSEPDRFTGVSTPHPLIGQVDFRRSIDDGIVFRRTFQPGQFILKDHQVHGLPVMPGVGYLEMAFAAASQLNSGCPISLSRVAWLQPLAVQKDKDVLIVIRNEGEKFSFEIQSVNDTEDPTEPTESTEPTNIVHSQGEIYLGEETATAAGANPVQCLSIEAIKARAEGQMDRETMHAVFARMGITYGPYFKGLVRVWANSEEALGYLQLPPAYEAELAQYIIHPTLADAAFQLLMGIIINPNQNLAEPQTYLPFSVETVETPALQYLKKHCYAYARKAGQNRFHILLLDESGRVCVKFLDLSVRKCGLPQPVTPLTPLTPLSLPSLIHNVTNRVESQIPSYGDERENQVLSDAIGRFSHCLLLRAFRQMGIFNAGGKKPETYDIAQLQQQLEIVPAYTRLFDALLEILEKAGFIKIDGRDVSGTRELNNWRLRSEMKNLERTKQQLEQDYPAFKAHLQLLWVCVNAYPDILRGRLGHMEVMFPNGSRSLVENVYKGNTSSDYYNHIAALAVKTYAEQRLQEDPRAQVTILEVGAGTGGTSAAVLEALREYGASVRYYYTDISAGFTRFGQETYGTTYPFASFKTLDIEKEPDRQGFAPGSFDLLIAANVLHATRVMNTTINHAGGLLKTNGLLVVNEIMQVADFATMTFGLTDGWWLYEDPSQRLKNSPLLDTVQWRQLLTAGGFRKINILGIPGTKEAKMAQGIIIAEREKAPDKVVPVQSQPLAVQKPVIIAPVSEPVKEPVKEPVRLNQSAELREKLADYVKGVFAAVLKMNRADIDSRYTFERYGVDSLVTLDINKEFGKNFEKLPTTLLFEYTTVEALTGYFLEQHRPAAEKVTGLEHAEPAQPAQSAQSAQPAEREERADRKASQAAAVTDPGDIFSSSFIPRPRAPHAPHAPHAHHAPRASWPTTGAAEPGRTKDIAIIGLAGRYPQSPTLDAFWENIKNGRNCIREIPPERWDWQKTGETSRENRPRWGGFIDDVDKFDPLFFNISPIEAAAVDPQERLFLETAWTLLEDAGVTSRDLEALDHRIGVFVGVMNRDYEWLGAAELTKGRMAKTNCTYSSIANRVSYYFNLQGPSLAVDTSCSSSLTALHLACESIKRGECGAAIAGGVNLILHPGHLHLLAEANMISADDKCKSFAVGADGFVPGEGVGAVFLKPLERALQDGDRIYAVIKGTAVNAGGKTGGYMIPNPNAQARLVKDALKSAGIHPRTISYLEAQATGSALGDPIEITGLTKAYEQYTPDKQFCAIGSVKSNIGHLESASGMAGLTRVLLQMQYQQLTPSIHTGQLNPHIDFENSPFHVQREVAEWKRPVIVEQGLTKTYPRRAGLSSFGAGGSNAHILLEEAPEDTTPQPAKDDQTQQLILLSARDERGLAAYALRMLEFLEKQAGTISLTDMAYTLQVARQPLEERLAFSVSTIQGLKELLTAYCKGKQKSSAQIYRGSAITGKGNFELSVQEEEAKELIKSLMRHRKLNRLAQLWVTGWEIDWRNAYEPYELTARPKRITLPTYPFAGERCWVGENAGTGPVGDAFPAKQEIGSILREVPAPIPAIETLNPTAPTAPSDPLENFFYQPVWTEAPLSETAQGHELPTGATVLILYAPQDMNLEKTLAQEHASHEVSLIKLGTKNREKNHRDREINIHDPRALDKCIGQFPQINRVYFLAETGTGAVNTNDMDALTASQERGVISLFRLVKALTAHGFDRQALQLKVITHTVYAVTPADGDHISPYAASLHGFTRSMAKEYFHWQVSCIDIDDQVSARALFHEPAHGPGEEIAWRRDKRYRRTLEPVKLPQLPQLPQLSPLETAPMPTPFKKQGVYLILGGAHGIGLATAEYLAETVQARLILIGRRSPDELPQEKLDYIRAKGGEVLYLQADGTDLKAMKAALRQAKSRFGKIDGAFHSAIVLKDRALTTMDEETLREVLASKVKGSVILYEVLKNEPLDFLAFFSSANSFSCSAGQSNYAAGCTFKDAFALYLHRVKSCPVKIINWGYWGTVGVVASQAYKNRFAAHGVQSIDPAEGMEAVKRILGHKITQVIALKAQPEMHEKIEKTGSPKHTPVKVQTVKVQTPPPQPDTSVGETVLQCVAEILGTVPGRIIKEKSFSEYGVNSVLALKLINKINDTLGILLRTTVLFDYTNAADLAQYINETYPQLPRLQAPQVPQVQHVRQETKNENEAEDDLMAMLRKLEKGECSPHEINRMLEL